MLGMLDGNGGEVELVDCQGPTKSRPASGAQGRTIVGHDEFGASHVARNQITEETASLNSASGKEQHRSWSNDDA